MLRAVWVRALASPGHPRPLSQRVTVGRWDYCGPEQAFCLDERYLHRHKAIGPFFAVLKSSDPTARILCGRVWRRRARRRWGYSRAVPAHSWVPHRRGGAPRRSYPILWWCDRPAAIANHLSLILVNISSIYGRWITILFIFGLVFGRLNPYAARSLNDVHSNLCPTLFLEEW